MSTALTADVPAAFDRLFLEACTEIGCEPIDLLGVMYSESACRASALNDGPADAAPDKRYNAVGLIQFMPPILLSLGFGRGMGPRDRALAFRHLDAVQQLPYVVAYFTPWGKTGKPWDSAGRLYQATFLPATLATQRAPTDVLVQRGGRLGWCYEANAAFDADGNGTITIGELTQAIARNCRGARWIELCSRLGIAVAPMPEDAAEIESIHDVQAALAVLGFDPGAADGIDGPRTRSAVRAFQAEHDLAVDGIAGPHTREALAVAVRDHAP